MLNYKYHVTVIALEHYLLSHKTLLGRQYPIRDEKQIPLLKTILYLCSFYNIKYVFINKHFIVISLHVL
jgi:hypothetical protein